MPTHEPELSEPYYSGDFYDGSSHGPSGSVVEYRYTEDDGYSYDPDAPGEVVWLSEPVASGPGVNLSNDRERRDVGQAILGHLFGRPPKPEEFQTFTVFRFGRELDLWIVADSPISSVDPG